MKQGLVVACWIAVAGVVVGFAEPSGMSRPNVLFVAVDDLRPELGCYGNPVVVSPHFDALARRGVLFERAYTQQAVCNPSRASFMTGLRPDSTGVYDLVTHFRKRNPDVITLPQLFKQQGYHTVAYGKIYHPAFPGYGIGSDLGDTPSWSEPAWLGGPRYYYSPLGVRLARAAYDKAINQGAVAGAPNWIKEVLARRVCAPDEPAGEDDWTQVNVRVLATEAPEVEDNVLYDGQVADRAVAALSRLKQRRGETGSPFFLAVGFLKPHLPFIAPRRYWDLYDPAQIQIADNPSAPADVPSVAMAIPLDELRDTYPKDVAVPGPGQSQGNDEVPYDLPQKANLTREQQVNLRRGYYACISYVDAQFGRILAELDRLGLSENTIIVVVGDHGFHLGQHGLWGKMTNFEDATRSPLIVSAPGRRGAGRESDALVELVDIYPTLCELAGLPLPVSLEGKSMVPLLDEPDLLWKKAAFSQYPRPGGIMGYTMRTDRYRFTRWQQVDDPSRSLGLELYDHRTDPDENYNLADQPDSEALVALLQKELLAGWREECSEARDGLKSCSH